jgi:hypothetical protein
LEESFPDSQHINKLLGKLGGAHGPEPAANTSCHNDQMVVDSCHSDSFFNYLAKIQKLFDMDEYYSFFLFK